MVFDRRTKIVHTLRVAKNKDGQRWSEDLVRRVGAAMKKARGAKSARTLSDETAALGYRVSPTVIAKLDSGHRGSVLSVAELLVLAAALDIPPGLLLFPGYPSGEVEFLPGRTEASQPALEWFSGERRIPAEPGKDGQPRVSPLNPGTELVKAVREYAELGKALRAELRLKAGGAMDPQLLDDAVRDAQERLADLEFRIDDLRRMFEITEKAPR